MTRRGTALLAGLLLAGCAGGQRPAAPAPSSAPAKAPGIVSTDQLAGWQRER
jgi:hypothetical protein